MDSKLNKREFIQATFAMGAATVAAPAGAAGDAGTAAPTAPEAPAADLLDSTFESVDAHGFTSDVIHLGEAPGFSVTPIEQAKNVRGNYQRPGSNATLGALETKLRSLEGAAQAVSAPS